MKNSELDEIISWCKKKLDTEKRYELNNKRLEGYEKEKITMELRRKWFSSASKLTEFVRTNHIEKENIQGIFLADSNGYELFYWAKVFAN